MLKNRTAVTIIGLATLLLMGPLIYNQHALLGVDGYFQYNRIYEAAMQLRHNNLSFMNLYSFQQAGRIVNSVYSPLVTYLAGALLLLTGTWFKFQLVSVFIVTFMSGYAMYTAARALQLPKRLSIMMGIVFLSSNAVYGFIFGVTWRSIALGLLPIFVSSIIDLYEGDWNLAQMLKLGLSVGLLAQFQILTLGIFLPFLVPFFLYGLWHSREKLISLFNLLAGVLLAILLSLNTLLPLLEVFRGNQLIAPVAMNLMDNASLIFQPIYNGVDSNSDIVLTIILYAMIMGIIMFWRQLSTFTRMFVIVVLVYLVMGTSLVPWDTIQNSMPFLQTFLQMPRRISLVGTPFLIIATALVYFDVSYSTEKINFLKNITSAGVFLALLSLILCNQKVAQNVHYTMQDTTTLASGLQTLDSHVYSQKGRIVDLQPAFHTRNLKKLIMATDRMTPDYIPITHKIGTNPKAYTRVYREYLKSFSAKQADFKYQVVDNAIQLSWVGKHAKRKSVPVVAYRRTVILLNGHRVKTANVNRNWIGSIVVQQRKGNNKLTVKYQTSFVTTLGTNLTNVAWLIVGLLLCYRKRSIARPL